MLWGEVGERIAKLRQNKKLTQTQFAECIGVSKNKLSMIERGKKTPGDLIPIICTKFGASADYIYFGRTDPLADIAFFRDFDPEEIEILFDLIKRCIGTLHTSDVNELLIKEIMRSQIQ